MRRSVCSDMMGTHQQSTTSPDLSKQSAGENDNMDGDEGANGDSSRGSSPSQRVRRTSLPTMEIGSFNKGKAKKVKSRDLSDDSDDLIASLAQALDEPNCDYSAISHRRRLKEVAAGAGSSLVGATKCRSLEGERRPPHDGDE